MAAGRHLNEAGARAEILRYGELAWARGLVFGTSGNLSCRLADGSVLVTPTARALRGLAAADLAHVDADGAPLGNGPRATSELPLHLAAYRARPEMRCVLHTHPTHCIVWSKTGRLFALDTVGARESLGTIAHTPYHPPGSQELAACCARAFAAGSDSVVMQDHGLTSLGITCEEAFVRTDLAEECARLSVLGALFEAARRP